MADVQFKHEKVQKAPTKKKAPQSSKRTKRHYCILCRKSYFKHEGHDHVQSMHHHSELEKVLGKDGQHYCQACKTKSLGLSEYANHIQTAQHQMLFKNLKTRNIKPVCLFRSLSSGTIKSILERNKTLKKEEKKAMRKTKKKQKQEAGLKRAETQQSVGPKRKLPSEGKMTKNPPKKDKMPPNDSQRTNFPGSNYGVIRNKENKTSHMPRPPPYRPFPDQSWRPPYQPGAPVGQPFHYHYGWQQDHQWYDGYYGENQHNQGKVNRFQTRPYNYRKPPADAPGQIMPAVSRNGFNQDSSVAGHSFPSNQLVSSQREANVFHHNQEEAGKSAESKGEKTDPVWLESSSDMAPEERRGPIRDVDVTVMLKQVRRALGVREPCRADREAQRQNANVHTGTKKQDDAEQPKETPTAADASVSPSAISSTAIPPLKHKQTNQTNNLQPKENQMNGDQSKCQEGWDDPSSLSGCAAKITSAHPNLGKPCKVRVAHTSRMSEAGTGTVGKKVLDKLHHLSGARSKLSWNEIYSGMKMRSFKGKQSFHLDLGIQSTDHKSPLQNDDLPLSEGFHWELMTDNTAAHTSAHSECLSEMQSISQTADYSEQPGIAQVSGSSKVKVKVEPEVEDESRKSIKRTFRMEDEDGLSDRSSCKKKKSKSRKDHLDQSQMDQLLAVSLREDELSHSLQDLDRSLIQARSALQAAYAEVQRLLLLKQQFAAEVNSLRAKRIEILQGMQVGYSGAGDRAATLSPGSASIMSTTSCPSSLSHQQPATTPAPFVTPPHPAPLGLPAVSLNQDVTHLLAAGQKSRLFLHPAVQPTADGSTLASTLPPDSSVRQQEQETRDRLKFLKMAVLKQQMQPSDLLEGTKLDASTDQDAGKEQEKVSDLDREGDESDSSVEVVRASDQDVIDVEESECEDSAGKSDPEQPEDPQKSASVEFSCASTQTLQQRETERRFQPAVNLKKDGSQLAESAEEDEPSLGGFSNHSGPVHGIQIHDGRLYTCSGDNTARAYSLLTRKCEAVFQGHTNKVNCLLVSSSSNMPARLYTGSSDQTICCYSIKSKKCLEQISLPDRVLCLHVAWNILYVGLASGSVISHDLKTLKELDVFECHGPRGVSCLGTAQEGTRRLLLVGSYDSTISVRDAKSGLLLRTLEGHTKTVLCMKVVNDLVFSGSSDTSVHAHNIHTRELVRIYKGHGQAVTSIVILGKVMVTACLDKLVRVYELQSHDRLQVYGGHTDMVMCMAVHKSVIYTGCYDGSVQAVKLNLMKNYRCWWQSCSLIFGTPEHLLQHLTRDHTNANQQTVKCRWKQCNHFFGTQQSVKQELPEHMQSHIESDSKLQP